MILQNCAKTCFLGDKPHPGDLQITKYCLSLCDLPPHATILDVGCGTGTTVHYLRSLEYQSYGIDVRRVIERNHYLNSTPFIQGNWFNLPIKENSFDAVMAECTFSIVKSLAKHLSEIRRVSRPGGILLMNGLYSRLKKPAQYLQFLDINCSLQFLKNSYEIRKLLNQTGFRLKFWQDQSEILKTYTLQQQILLWDPQMFNLPYAQDESNHDTSENDIFDLFLNVSKLKLGYYVAIAERIEEDNHG